MEVYILLIFSHVIGDIYLQRTTILRKILKGRELWYLKRQKIKYLILHVMLYSLSVSAILIYLKLFTIYKFLVVFISHFIIDYLKCYAITYKYMSWKFFAINLIDQLLHISVLFIIASL